MLLIQSCPLSKIFGPRCIHTICLPSKMTKGSTTFTQYMPFIQLFTYLEKWYFFFNPHFNVHEYSATLIIQSGQERGNSLWVWTHPHSKEQHKFVLATQEKKEARRKKQKLKERGEERKKKEKKEREKKGGGGLENKTNVPGLPRKNFLN